MRPRSWGTDYSGGGVCGKPERCGFGAGEATEGVCQRDNAEATVCELAAPASLLKQLGVRTGADEIDLVSVNLIDEEEIAADVAFAMVGPIACQGVVAPFGGPRGRRSRSITAWLP